MNEPKIELNLINQVDSFMWSDQIVKCDSYIGLENKLILLHDYMRVIAESIGNNLNDNWNVVDAYLTAEYTLILGVTQLCTNIPVEGDNRIDIDILIGSGLWNKICSCIKNYCELERDVEIIRNLMLEKMKMDKSISIKLDLIVDKISQSIDNFSKIDINLLGDKIQQFQDEIIKLNTNVPGIVSKKESPKRKPKKTNIE